jgi:hypothetical protein
MLRGVAFKETLVFTLAISVDFFSRDYVISDFNINFTELSKKFFFVFYAF